MKLASKPFCCAASCSAVPCRSLFCCSQLFTSVTWPGLVALVRTCASRGSGYSATGASNCSSGASDGFADGGGAVFCADAAPRTVQQANNAPTKACFIIGELL